MGQGNKWRATVPEITASIVLKMAQPHITLYRDKEKWSVPVLLTDIGPKIDYFLPDALETSIVDCRQLCANILFKTFR